MHEKKIAPLSADTRIRKKPRQNRIKILPRRLLPKPRIHPSIFKIRKQGIIVMCIHNFSIQQLPPKHKRTMSNE
jgi:hypothetical protein